MACWSSCGQKSPVSGLHVHSLTSPFHLCASCTCTHTHTPTHTHTNDLTWCCSGSVTSMAYSWLGWFLHTLPWLSTSPRRTSRQNRIVSTFQRIWRERKGEGEGEEREETESKREEGSGMEGIHCSLSEASSVTLHIKLCIKHLHTHSQYH